MKKLILTLFALNAVALGCTTMPSYEVRVVNENLHILTIESVAVAKNTIEELTEQPMAVLLPPNYDSTKNYPIIYLLHGHGGNSYTFLSYQDLLIRGMKNGSILPAIFVTVNSNGKYSGTFYTNSPVLGYWEDHIVKEVIPLVEQRYLPEGAKPRRGIAGHSMGGTGALNLTLSNPDLFQAVWTYGAGVFDPEGLEAAYRIWRADSGFYRGYSLAWAGEERDVHFDNSPEDTKFIHSLSDGFGNWDTKFDQYESKRTVPPAHIRLVAGQNDGYVWIREGNAYLSRYLLSIGYEHEYDTPMASHSLSNRLVIEDMGGYFTHMFQ